MPTYYNSKFVDKPTNMTAGYGKWVYKKQRQDSKSYGIDLQKKRRKK